MAITKRSARAGLIKSGGIIDIKADGVDAATEVLAILAGLGATTVGVSLAAKKYPGGSGPTVGDVINFLAGKDRDGETDVKPPGGIKRDIRPTSEDSDAAARLLVTEAERRLRMTTRHGKALKRWGAGAKAAFLKDGQKVADNIAAAGLRAGGKLIKKIMSNRVESGMYRPPTSEDYARARLKKYGIAPSVALRASGLLLKNLQGGRLLLSRRRGRGGALSNFV